MKQTIEIRCENEVWNLNTVAVHLWRSQSVGKRSLEIALPLKWKKLTEEESGCRHEPALRLQPDEAQQLMDQLWMAGLRPAEGAGSAGQMAATQKHLEDLRTLVFLGVPTNLKRP